MRQFAIVFSMVAAMCISLVGDAQKQPPTGSLATVVQLYKDWAWEMVIAPSPFELTHLVEQPRPVLERYFDDELVALLLKDRECVNRTHLICALDFDFMFASNSPSGHVGIAATSDPSVVTVNVYLPQEQPAVLRYTLRQTTAGWRIHDIAQTGGRAGLRWSLLTLLRRGGV